MKCKHCGYDDKDYSKKNTFVRLGEIHRHIEHLEKERETAKIELIEAWKKLPWYGWFKKEKQEKYPISVKNTERHSKKAQESFGNIKSGLERNWRNRRRAQNENNKFRNL